MAVNISYVPTGCVPKKNDADPLKYYTVKRKSSFLFRQNFDAKTITAWNY